MSSIKEIVEIESHRQDVESGRIIHLFQDGSFYRVYEWSAWLFSSRIKQFKVSHRTFKGIEDSVAMVGFPVTSLSALIPDGSDVIEVKEKTVDLILPESIIPFSYDFTLLQSDFKEWKKELPAPDVAKDSGKGKGASTKTELTAIKSPRVTDILQRILSFNVNKKTPFECMEFVSDIQEQLMSLL